jgi:subfamily B ATP-binding cassette protein MsbA
MRSRPTAPQGSRRFGRNNQVFGSVPTTPVNWRRLVHYLSPYKVRMVIIFGALMLTSAAALVFPLVIVRLLESVLRQQNMTQLNALATALVGLSLFQSAVSFLQSYNLTYVGKRIVLDVRTSLYRHLQELSLDVYAHRRVGEIISRLSSDVTQVRAVLTNNVTQLLSQTVSLIGSVAIVFALNPRLTIFTLVLVPVIVMVAILFGRSFQELSTRVQDELANVTTAAEESLQGVRVVKSFAREPYEVERYNRAMQQTFAVTLRLAVFRSLFGSTMAFLGFSAIAAVLWFGGREVIAGRLSLPLLTGFLIYGLTIAANIGGLAELYGQFREALGAVRRVFELLDTAPSIINAPDAHNLHTVQGRITFDQVSFHYDANVPVIQNIMLDIAPGEIVALVGPSGAGKSTLFNLIPRFYDPTAGTVSIDGHDLRAVTQCSLRQQIGIVPQETLLFGGTIRENIAYGRLDATEDQMVAAAQAANAHEFIMALPNHYATVVGERGVKLSGGQRQRVAIARDLERSTHFAARRSDQCARQRIGRAGAGRAGPADARPYHGDHRPSLEHDQDRAPYRRAGSGQAARSRHA